MARFFVRHEFYFHHGAQRQGAGRFANLNEVMVIA